jgi:hypothetical protein
MASPLVFVEAVQPHDGEPSEKGDAHDTANETLASDAFFRLGVFFVGLFGVRFVAEELVVRADEEQVVGVSIVVNGWVVAPAGIPIVFPRSLLLRPTLVTQRGALDAREAAMELRVGLIKVRVVDEIGVNLDDTVRPETLGSA